MEKKKIYIFFSSGLCGIGGAELYMAGKSIWLKSLGWTVYACTAERNQGYALIPALNEFLEKGCGWTFLMFPPYKYKKYEQEQNLNFMIQKLDLADFDNCEIIIETHFSAVAFWGELLAERIKGRHFFVACEEEYRYNGSFYEDNLDYFYFKWKRNELTYEEIGMMVRLFNGYKGITKPLVEMPPNLREMDAIQDVEDFPIDKIARLDYNICHVGRIVKAFVPYVIEGVAKFAKRHPDKKINFIFVGDIAWRRDFIIKTFNDIDNVQLTALGDMVPIPRILFSKVDVACAIADSAIFVASENVYTITGKVHDPEKTSGLLGYDTNEDLYGEGKYTWDEALENVLVKRLYDNKQSNFTKMKPADWYYNNFWTIVKNAAPEKEYYVERLSQERIRDWTATFPFGAISRGTRIIFFGATEIARDYRCQVENQSNSQIEYGNGCIKQYDSTLYCTIVATVDEHPEEFDNSVVGVERLLQKDYDVILITTYPQQMQAAFNKITEVVPDMISKVFYNFQILKV